MEATSARAHAYLAAIGASGALLAAIAVAFGLLLAMVGFEAGPQLPGIVDDEKPPAVEIGGALGAAGKLAPAAGPEAAPTTAVGRADNPGAASGPDQSRKRPGGGNGGNGENGVEGPGDPVPPVVGGGAAAQPAGEGAGPSAPGQGPSGGPSQGPRGIGQGLVGHADHLVGGLGDSAKPLAPATDAVGGALDDVGDTIDRLEPKAD
jgi:hypothetical protein